MSQSESCNELVSLFTSVCSIDSPQYLHKLHSSLLLLVTNISNLAHSH